MCVVFVVLIRSDVFVIVAYVLFFVVVGFIDVHCGCVMLFVVVPHCGCLGCVVGCVYGVMWMCCC